LVHSMPIPVSLQQACWVRKEQTFGQFERDLGSVLRRGYQLCKMFAGSKAKKEKCVIERRRLRKLLKRLTKNIKTLSRLQAQCCGHPASAIAHAILTRLSLKIKRDEAAFNVLADAALREE